MSNSLKSSDFSPIPTYLKGTLNLSASAKTTPPLAVPSNLVKQRPVTFTA